MTVRLMTTWLRCNHCGTPNIDPNPNVDPHVYACGHCGRNELVRINEPEADRGKKAIAGAAIGAGIGSLVGGPTGALIGIVVGGLILANTGSGGQQNQ